MGNYTAGNFHLGAYGATGTLVYDPPAVVEANANGLVAPHQA
jgi:hypothetical protein